MPANNYIPEKYWNEVATRIRNREGSFFLAGDDEPYYHYKRQKFLQLLHSIHFKDKKVLEVGSGPGGNLAEIYSHNPKELHGVDIAAEMIDLAVKNLGDKKIVLQKINGIDLPFSDSYFDITLTSTVLQHITDDNTLKGLILNICRVTSDSVYIFERIEKSQKRYESNIGRTIEEYRCLFNNCFFSLEGIRYANVHWSYISCGIVRKIFGTSVHKEGEKRSGISGKMQKIMLGIARPLDSILPVKRDLAMLHFVRNKT